MPTKEHRARRQKHLKAITLKPKSPEPENQETKDLVAAYKPNAAFFEAYGVEALSGWTACG